MARTRNPVNIPILRRLIPSIMKRIYRYKTADGWLVKSVGGHTYLLNYNNFVDRQILFYEDFEREQLAYLNALSADMSDALFLDVGSNIGYYAIQFAKHANVARVIAFEPDPRNLYQLHANIRLNNVIDQIQTINKAASEEPGRLRFQLYGEGSTGQNRVSDSGNVEVDAVALDSEINAVSRNIIIKMDIEGHELSALKGMKTLLTSNRVVLQVETFSDSRGAVIDFLQGLGFKQVNQIDEDLYFSNTA